MGKLSMMIALWVLAVIHSANAQKNVILISNDIDTTVKRISIAKTPISIPAERPVNIVTENVFNGAVKLNITITNEDLLEFRVIGNTYVIPARPGDSLFFQLRMTGGKLKLDFFGANSEIYNLYVMLHSTEGRPTFSDSVGLAAYKSNLASWSLSKQQDLKEHILNTKINGDDSSKTMSILRASYLGFLYSPFRGRKIKELPPGYLDDEPKNVLKDDRVLQSLRYKSGVFNKYIGRYLKDTTKTFSEILTTINAELNGNTKNYAISNLIAEYVRKQNPSDSLDIKEALMLAYSNVSDTAYVNYLKQNELQYFVLNKKLPDRILDNTTLVDFKNSKSITLRQVLASQIGKGVYIDLWASWCIPCRNDIANSSSIKSYLKEQGYTVIYFSMDTDQAAWKKASQNDRITEFQFLIGSDKKTSFMELINLQGIPRYLLLNKSHNVKSLYAPRPIPSSLNQFQRLTDD